MKITRHIFSFIALLTVGLVGSGFATAQAQTTVGWNFTDLNGTFDTGSPANFTLGNMSIANSWGTVTTPISAVSVSSGYAGATGGGNIGNAVHNEAFSTSTSPYFTVTFTPSAGYSLQFTKFDFGMRSTGTGATVYALYSSVDNYTAPIFTGSNTANSAWTLKSNPAFILNGVLDTPVTLRLYTYGGGATAGSGTINTRLDDVAITVTASATPTATEVRVETAADGSGLVVPAQTITPGSSMTAYAISRDAVHTFIANAPASWSLTNKTGGVVDGDLVAAGDGKSAIFTPQAGGSAVIHAVIGGLSSVDSGVITVNSDPTNPTAVATADATTLTNGQTVSLTVTVTPGANPPSTGITVTGDLSQIGGAMAQVFTPGPGNTFTWQTMIPANLAGGTKNLSFAISDAQSRNTTASLALTIRGNLAIFHTNDTHARVTAHKWVVPQHSNDPAVQFEDVGGVAYMGAKVLSLTASQPDALVLDGGDISEGNPIGDWNGPGYPTGTYGDGTIVDYYKLLDSKLKTIPGRGGRGLDAMVVGNHDIRDISYLNNLKDPSIQFPVISMNICNHGTHTPYFAPYVIVNANGNKIGIVGYTTESADSPEPAVNNAIDVVKCDWSSTDSTKIHFADYVNELRNNQGCNMVILLTHMGHSGLCTPTGSNPTPILVDTPAAKLPEIVVSGHWHTYCETIWQPTSLNYKTIFTEAGSFQHYVGELRVNGLGKYVSSIYYPLRNSAITPDPDIATFIQTRKDQYAATNPPYDVDQVVGYTADDLLLDNYLKWWSADEYPWSGNNTAGNWICDAMQWKATALFGHCDLSLESGGGVRSDIVAGPIKYTNIYETFPWPDDTIYLVQMTGQEIWNYFKGHNCDAAMSGGWHVTAHDGVPTAITYNGQPVDLAHSYDVAINNYMYLHDSVPFTDTTPTFAVPGYPDGYLARTALVDYTSQFTAGNPYDSGPSRYTLDTEFSGGYRAVVTMMNDADSREAFEDGFIRFLSALPETLAHRGKQVPLDFVHADGTANRANRLTENEWYRSYLGFKNGAVQPGDIVEIWGKGAFFGGNPEFVDQEGIQSDGVEFKIVGHDASLAQPAYVNSIATALDDWHKNHYVKFVAQKTGTSTVVDKSGTPLTVQDVTGYANKTLPGSVGNLLVITGVPTSESYAMRFRADNAVLASSQGINGYPPDSHANSLDSVQTGAPLAVTATASVAPGSNENFYTLEPVADAQVESGVPGGNFGTSTNIFIESAATGTFQNERGWFRFDLSSIPSGSTITSATLNLFCWRATGASLPTELRGGDTDTWGETTITWNNQPTFGSVLSTQTLAAGVVNTLYGWDATSFAQTKFAGNQLVSLLVKPVTEDSTDTVSPSYGFDSKEYTANHPYLRVTTPTTGSTTVAQVQFFYRYSADNLSPWTAWTSFQTLSSSPWTATFGYPNGYGFYEFYTVATDSAGSVEPAPPFADTWVQYAAAVPTPTPASTATPTATPTPAATATPTAGATPTPGPFAISGIVRYCSNPALDPVPDVTLTLTGATSGSAMSDTSGNYSLPAMNGGSYIVTPSKTALTPGSPGISTVDVLAVQRHFLNIAVIPAGCRLVSADVNGDTSITTVDVIAIQRFFLGQTAGTANVGKYNFSPASRSYPGVSGNQSGQNYDTLIFGDVASGFVHRPENSNGNEDNSDSQRPSVVSEVELPTLSLDQSREGSVAPVTTSFIDRRKKLVGFQGDIVFDERVIAFEREPVQAAGLTGRNWNVSGNVLPDAGPVRKLRVSGYSTDFAPLSGEGTLFELKIKSLSGLTRGADLIWSAQPNQFIFIDANLDTQHPEKAPPGVVSPASKE